MSPIPTTPTAENVGQRAAALQTRWRHETAYESSSSLLTGHPAYQELIALGLPALPFLFRDLEQTRDGHLSRALAAITGARPVPAEDRGQVRKVADAWLRWAKENGY